MGVTVNCDSSTADDLYDQLGTDICRISTVKWEASAVASVLLIGIIVYMMQKWKYRCHKTLLTFHNLRAAVALLLLAINTIELAKALLPQPGQINQATAFGGAETGAGIGAGRGGGGADYGSYNGDVVNDNQSNNKGNGSQTNLPSPLPTPQLNVEDEIDQIVIVLGTSELVNALTALLVTITLMWYHRVVEIKKSLEFLYVSSTLAVLIFILRIYELAEIVYYDSFMELESIIQVSSAVCLLLLAVIDGFTVYKERYRPDYFEDHEKIGYKHTLATLYSKACFWWLTPLLKFGYKEPLELEDLGQMRIEDSARAHYDRFLLIYKTAKVKNSDIPPSLWLCYLKSSWRMFTLGGLLKLFGDLFAVIGPLAIQQIVQYIEIMYGTHYDNKSNNTALRQIVGVAGSWDNGSPGNNQGNNINASSEFNIYSSSGSLSSGAEVKIYCATWLDLVSNGWCVAWMVLLAALAQGGLSQASTHILNMTGIHIKTSLQGLIYRKTLLLNATCIETQATSSSNINTTTTPNSTGTWTTSLGNGRASKANGKGTSSPLWSSSSPTNGSKPDKGVNTNCTNIIPKDNNDNPNNEDLSQQEGKGMQNSNNTKSIENNALNDVGAITNLMSEDTLNIMSFFWIAHYVWAIPLKIGIVMYLLYLKLGISAVIGSFVCILTMTPLQFLIGKSMSRNAEVMAKYTDNRLKKLHDCFVGIKLIKLNAWDNVFIKKINEARKMELKYLNKDSLYWTMMTILTHICSVLITFVTLAVYVYRETGADFTASRLFSALALFQQLTVPLLIFPITVPIILSAIVSTRRLERFLSAPEIQKQFEGIRNMARILSKSDASLDMYENKSQSLPANITLKTAQEQVKPSAKSNDRQNIKIFIPEKPAPLANSEPHTPLMLQDGKECLEYPVDHKKLSSHARKELLRNTPYVVIRPRKQFSAISTHHQNRDVGTQQPQPQHQHQHQHQHPHPHPHHQMQHRQSKTDSWHRDSLLLKMPDDIAVSVKDCKFSWNPQKMSNILFVRDFVVPRGKLTMIVGKNGSGKSSLLSALLMEMPLISGDMIWNKTSTIAFVPQQPWLLNASIRENILFGESFRPKRYDFVLNACALKPDIDLMPAGDLTVIGERGINLSGGQRQRVAIARALYSSANVVIMGRRILSQAARYTQTCSSAIEAASLKVMPAAPDPGSGAEAQSADHSIVQDDPLSSLDNEVARHIFEQSIRKMLLKANRTVILVTQQLNLVQQAHNLIVLKDGYLQASGSYKDIAATHPHIIAKWNSIIAKANEKEQQNSMNDAAALGRTARERWKLFKNVAKLGLQRSPPTTPTSLTPGTATTASPMDAVDAATEINTTLMGNILAADEEEEYDIMPASSGMGSTSSFKLSRTPSAIYGPRHLIYDVPLPLDECQTDNVIMRRRQRTGSKGDSAFKNQRPSSRTSSRMSNVSNTPTELRRSILTNSCGSAVSYMTNLSSTSGDESRTQSWQTVAGSQSLVKNVPSPSEECWREDELDTGELAESSSTSSGFHQFLRRMSMRKSNKSKGGGVAVSQHRKVRPGSGDTAILSISEESSGNAASSIPSIELSSVATETETETESWIAGIENEESIQDASNIDYKTLLANNDTSPQMTTEMNTSAQDPVANIAPTIKGMTSGRRAATMTMSYDVERKYGKIPAEIYLLYLRASGLTIVLIFFITALIWQTLRVYTDVWLQQWTDDNSNSNINKNNNHNNHNYHNVAALHAITSANISSALLQPFSRAPTSPAAGIVQQMSHHNYARTTAIVAALTSQSPPPTAASEALLHLDPFDGGLHHEVTYYFHMYAVISCICIIMAMISTPAGQWAGCKARQNLHDQLLQSIMHKSLHFFQVTPLGRIMNRFSNDMAIIDKKIAATSQRLLQFTLLCLCAILINVIITPWFMVVTVPVCLAYYAIQKFYRCSSRELQRIENATNSPVISHLSETIQGVTTIRAYNQESRFTEILFRRLEENTIAFTILNTSNRWLGISLDYLGGIIVFVAIVTALLAATIACTAKDSQHMQRTMTMVTPAVSSATHGTTTMTTEVPALTPSPSLVGLAINYTLLMPIYLNWVVKLLADMEMYVGSVERIAYYAESDDRSRKETTSLPTTTTTTSAYSVNNNRELVTRVPAEEREQVSVMMTYSPAHEGGSSSPQDVVELKNSGSTSVGKVCNNDKLFGLSEMSDATPIPTSISTAATTRTLLSTTDKNIDKTVAGADVGADIETPLLVGCSNEDDSVIKLAKKQTDNLEVKATVAIVAADTADDNDDAHHRQHITNDGHIAVTAESLTHKQTTNYSQYSSQAAAVTTQLPLLSLSKSKTSAEYEGSRRHHWEQRNDVERRASIRRRDKVSNNNQYKPVAISWPQRGDISFENVSLRYEGQHTDVIKNFNLHIPAGQRIGICGRTGSGKSSLALSLFGVLQVSHGQIHIDDMDISHIHPDEVRTRLSIIPQDVHLFCMTIRENLDPSGYYSDFELWNCLELAQLKDFVNTKMPQGLDTEIMDGGINLSVGHRQLFCLARAILRGSVCLVLDEATSALDSTTEKALLAAAHKAFQGRTIITIAHRLSTIMDYDRVIVLEKGQIIEDGDPYDLKQRPNGIFAAFVKSGRPLSTLSADIEVQNLV